MLILTMLACLGGSEVTTGGPGAPRSIYVEAPANNALGLALDAARATPGWADCTRTDLTRLACTTPSGWPGRRDKVTVVVEGQGPRVTRIRLVTTAEGPLGQGEAQIEAFRAAFEARLRQDAEAGRGS